MTSITTDPRIKHLPKWAQHHIANLESTLRTIQEQNTPPPNKTELWLSGARLHIRNLSPDRIDVNFAGLFLIVYPQAANHIILARGTPERETL